MRDNFVFDNQQKKAGEPSKSAHRKIVVDFLNRMELLSPHFTGTLEMVFNQGQIIGTKRIEKDPF